eukprot:scaffold65251_cov19-Tisochrysis_lutea.AAC.2
MENGLAAVNTHTLQSVWMCAATKNEAVGMQLGWYEWRSSAEFAKEAMHKQKLLGSTQRRTCKGGHAQAGAAWVRASKLGFEIFISQLKPRSGGRHGFPSVLHITRGSLVFNACACPRLCYAKPGQNLDMQTHWDTQAQVLTCWVFPALIVHFHEYKQALACPCNLYA